MTMSSAISSNLPTPPLGDQLVKNKARIRVRYLDYDWTLNGK
jgi:hypothetical protein